MSNTTIKQEVPRERDANGRFKAARNTDDSGDVQDITVEFYGRSVNGRQIAPGILSRMTSRSVESFLIQCSVTNKWMYCSKARLEKLTEKSGSLDLVSKNYISKEAIQNSKEVASNE